MKNAPRTLDVDLIVVGDRRSDDDALRLPHPRAAERAFVLQPWLDLEPDAEFPDAGPVADLLEKTDQQRPEAARRPRRSRSSDRRGREPPGGERPEPSDERAAGRGPPAADVARPRSRRWAVVGLVGGWLLHPSPSGSAARRPGASPGRSRSRCSWSRRSSGPPPGRPGATVHVHRRAARAAPAVNRLVLARACAYVGALVAGGYLGYAVSWLGVDARAGRPAGRGDPRPARSSAGADRGRGGCSSSARVASVPRTTSPNLTSCLPHKARRRQRSTRLTVAAALVIIAAVVVLGAVLSGSWLLLVGRCRPRRRPRRRRHPDHPLRADGQPAATPPATGPSRPRPTAT